MTGVQTCALPISELGSTVFNPMLIRWSDQGDPSYWTPSATNQAGFTYLSHGSEIVTALQARQEILTFTDSSVYSLQYVGAPVVWQVQLVGENTSIASQNAVAYANGVAYWMGVDKFYKYDGRSQTLNCDLRQFVFENINKTQFDQVYAGTNEGFNEVWWFYVSQSGSQADPANPQVDKYVIYNYLDRVWYYGTINRTAWLDSGIRQNPMGSYIANLTDLQTNKPLTNPIGKVLYHEVGNDDASGLTVVPIEAYVQSSDFDIGDGHNFG